MVFKNGDKVVWDSANGVNEGTFIKFHKNGYAIVKQGSTEHYLNDLNKSNLRK